MTRPAKRRPEQQCTNAEQGIGKMLFNSVEFIAGFLPVVLIGFFVLTGSGRQRLAVIWLTIV